MVIRRIREHVTSHNWFAVCLDLAIVIAGVFIATQATNWNDARIEREQSRSYQARLVDELNSNDSQFRHQIAYYKQVRAHGLATLRALQSPAALSGRDFLIDAYQTTHIDTAYPKRFIYDELVSAGLVNRLGSPHIQRIVGDYYLWIEAIQRSLEDVLPYRSNMRALMPYAAQMQIRNQCGDIEVYDRRRVVGYRLPELCDVNLDDALVRAAVLHIREQPKLVDDLTRYLASLDEKIGALEGTIVEAEKLKTMLLAASRQDEPLRAE